MRRVLFLRVTDYNADFRKGPKEATSFELIGLKFDTGSTR
jgi:hypothetical protein